MLETDASQPLTPDLATLVALFYDSPQTLGTFDAVEAQDMPARYAGLLAHDEHMTVTVENFHNTPVQVTVLERQVSSSHYARKILLSKQSDGCVVQYGIMRVNFAYLEPTVRRQIEAEDTPLGRVLINNNVLRSVHLAGLWRVTREKSWPSCST